MKFLTSLIVAALAAASLAGCDDDKLSGRVERLVLDEEFARGYMAYLDQTFSIAGKVTIVPAGLEGMAETYSSSDPEVASVDAEGNVTVHAEGSTTLTITVDEKTVSFILIVSRVMVESLDLDATFANGYLAFIDQSFSIAGKVIVAPANATYKEESYASTNPTVATVDEAGTVIALAEGESTLSITVDGVSVQFLLTVSRTLVESVTLDPLFANGLQTATGEIFSLADKVTITPANATIQQKIYNSSDTGVATVDEDGNVQTVGEGETTITVTVDGVNASFTLTVAKVPVESLTLDPALASGYGILTGQTFSIAGKVTVTPGNATYKAETYASSDTGVATVDVNGNVNALIVGTTTLTITVDGQTADFLLTVSKVPVESLELDATFASGYEVLLGQNFSIAGKVTVTPANATYQVESYSSSNGGVATVDASGNVTTVSGGTTTLTITVDGVDAPFLLTVGEPAPEVSAIDSDQDHYVVEVGQTTDIFAQITLTPANASYLDVTFSSSSLELATVAETGVVTGAVAGDVVVTVASKANPTVKRDITVEVIDPGFTINDAGVVTAYSGPGGDIRVPAAGKIIAGNVFKNNATLTTIHLNQVTEVQGSAFNPCANLTRVVAPNLITILGSAFLDCPNLVEVVGDKIVTMKNAVFQNCFKLESINLENVNEIGQFAFAFTNLEHVYMPSLVTISERRRQFSDCPRLVSVDMPALKTINVDMLFMNCPLLSQVNMPELENLAKVTVNQGSGQQTFVNCTGLVEISLPKLKNLRAETFLGCTALERLYVTSEALDTVDANSIPLTFSGLIVYVAYNANKALFPATASYTVSTVNPEP